MRGLLVVVAVGALARGAHAAPNALDKPAFTATPQELLALGKASPAAGKDVVLLREDNDVSYDDRGRMTVTWRLVFYVATKNGADNWDVLTSTWLPAHQDKPSVRARVIAANGRTQDLDPSLMKDEPESDSARAAPTDRRRLEVPLPRLSIGAVVEEQVVTTDREPLIGGGAAAVLDFSGTLELRSVRITLSSRQKLRTLAHGIAYKPKTQTSGGRQTQTFATGPLPAWDAYEYYIPSDMRPFRVVLATPVASWTSIARDYRAIIDKRIGEGAITLPVDVPKGGIEAVRAIQAWVHKQVQVENVGLDDTSPIPSTPADTLKRGTGDAKDMATLFVAALRQAGIKANVALINVGPGADLDRDIPGFNFFDYALVRAQIGKTELWFDPTARATPPGRLPWYDQGRLALIIADDTKVLVPTPQSSMTDNLVREVRTFEIAESGSAKVTEVSREGGVFEAEQRSWIRDTPADDVRKHLTKYVADIYRGELVSYSSSAPEDLTKPFETTIVGKDSMRAYADREVIDVYLFPTDTLLKLPELLREKPDADDKPRKRDFKISSAHVYEIENRLVVPAGFTMPSTVPERVRDLGALKLVERQRIDGRTLIVTHRLETTKTRLTPAEVTKTQQAIAALRKEENEHIVIQHTALALADQGKYRDALAEVNQLIKQHPKEAIHHQQLAQVLLKAGACEPARRAARKATELEPKNADAYVVLAWVLQYDSMCQWLGYDHDRAAARTALEKARKLDPKHLGAANDLASLLERDAKGRRFEAGADVRGAVEAWRALRAIEDNDERAYAMATALLWIGNGVEAEKVLRAMPVAERRDQLLTAAAAITGGRDAAVRTASSLDSSARIKNLTTAGSLMFLLRRYDVMRALFAEVGKSGGSAPWDDVLKKLARHDKPFKPAKTPQDAVMDAILAAASGRTTNAYWDAKTREEAIEHDRMAESTFKRQELMTDALLEDMLRSAIVMKVDGDSGLWRVELESFGVKAPLYVAADRGTPKIIGSPEAIQGVGRHILRLVAKNDEKSALRLLDWLDKDLGAHKGSFSAHRFSQLWGANLPRTRKDIEVVGAMLAGRTDGVRAAKILADCKPSTKDGQFICDWALADVYRDSKRWTELLDHSQAWLGRSSSTPVLPTVAQVYALAHLGKLEEADRVAAAAVAKDPGNRFLVLTHADIAVARGQLGEAVRRLDPLTSGASPERSDLNNLAWLELVEGSDLKNAATIARRAVQLDAKEPHTANTLAAIEAELGELQQANQHLATSLEGNHKPKPVDADLYVHARVLEQLGYADDAIAIYRKLKPNQEGFDFIPDSAQLAAKRLKALGITK